VCGQRSRQREGGSGASHSVCRQFGDVAARRRTVEWISRSRAGRCTTATSASATSARRCASSAPCAPTSTCACLASRQAPRCPRTERTTPTASSRSCPSRSTTPTGGCVPLLCPAHVPPSPRPGPASRDHPTPSHTHTHTHTHTTAPFGGAASGLQYPRAALFPLQHCIGADADVLAASRHLQLP